ncbi:MAG: tRNA (adenosine(37)-N6)-dimethylallyltransferase MiaA [Chitinophagaceae bacterium]
MSKHVLLIMGPTAVGKTSLAISLAKHFQTSVISADSRQCFRELKIGVARPSGSELQGIKHYFIASHSVREEVTAVTFEQYALEKAHEIFREKDILVMAGGTGLYIKAFCEGLDEIPDIRPGIRERIAAGYEKKGLDWLQTEIRKKDPEFFSLGEIQNPQRMMRALEVIESTGKSILAFRKGEKAKRNFNVIKIGIELPRDLLNQRIDARVDSMMEAGLLEEVRSLLPYRDANALQTVGYAELFDHLDGKISLETAVAEIKTHTRQYAKRQMTWFKRDPSVTWYDPGDTEKILRDVALVTGI